MTQEEKQLLLQDLCARLPYGVKVYVGEDLVMTLKQIDYKGFCESWENEDFKCHSRWMLPYLRSLSSMTEEEKEELLNRLPKYWSLEIDKLGDLYFDICDASYPDIELLTDIIDWLNKKMFAYRTINGKDMFELGLALKAPDGMYNNK